MIDTEGGSAEWSFPAEPGSVRGARNAVRETLRAWELGPPVIDLTVLLVSELVTNSLRHATGPIGVRLVRPGDTPRTRRTPHPTTTDCWWRCPIRFRIFPPGAAPAPTTRGPGAPAGGLFRTSLGDSQGKDWEDGVVRAASVWLGVEGDAQRSPEVGAADEKD